MKSRTRALMAVNPVYGGDVVGEQHPAEISDLYAASITDCTVVSATGADTVSAIGDFCDAVIASWQGFGPES